MSTRGEKLEKLHDWLIEAGAVGVDKVRVRPTEALVTVANDPLCEEYAVFLSSDAQPSEVVLRIPLICMITVEMGMVTDIGQSLIRHEMETMEELDLSSPKHCFLAIFLLTDRRNPHSWYQPYYQALPETFPNVPLYWSEEDLSYLRGSHMLYLIKDRLENLEMDYNVLCETAPAFSEFTLEEFTWARMTVASRNFGIEIDGNHTDALCPLADMLNHRRPRQTKWAYDSTTSEFKVESIGLMYAGTELLDSYGRKCNTRYLLNYGFCTPDNYDADGRCYNEVRLFLALDPEDSAYLLKKQLAGTTFYRVRVSDNPSRKGDVFFAGLGEYTEETDAEGYDDAGAPATAGSRVLVGRGARISQHHDDPSSREAFSLLRFVCAKAETGRCRELIALPSLEDCNLQSSDEEIIPLSRHNEADALSLLSGLSQEQLARYPCHPEQRQEEGKEADSSNPTYKNARQRFAALLVDSERGVCEHWIRLAGICVPLLRAEEEKASITGAGPGAATHIQLLAVLSRARDLAAAPGYARPNDPSRRYLEDVVIPLLEGDITSLATHTHTHTHTHKRDR